MNQNEAELRNKSTLLNIAIACGIFAFPSLHRELGWLASLIPLPVFYCLVLYGKKEGKKIIVTAVGCAALIAILFGSLTYFLFSLTMVPVGIMLAQSVGRNEPLITAGSKSVLLLAGSWLLFAVLYSLGNQTSFYGELLEGLDRGFAATIELYRDSGQFSPEALKELEHFLQNFQMIIGKMLPSLVLSSIICSVWVNVVIGQRLLKKKGANLLPWQDLKHWRLPDFFVWPLIFAGTALIVPGETTHTVGLNIGMVMFVLYFTQGMAIISFFMRKWSVLPIVRAIIYTMLLLQIYGLVLIAAIGLADVWIGFRSRKQDTATE